MDEIKAAERERDEAQAHAADLRGALEVAECYIKIFRQDYAKAKRDFEWSEDQAEIDGDLAMISAALATTAPQALGRIRAGVLREVCKDRASGGLCQRVAVDYLEWTNKEPLASQLHSRPMMRLSVLDADEVMREADRLEAAQ